MNNYLENIKEKAKNGKIVLIIGGSLSDLNPWEYLMKEILSFISTMNPSIKNYIEEIKARNIPIEAFFRILYKHIGENIFSILKGFKLGSSSYTHYQIADLISNNFFSAIGVGSIDNRLKLAIDDLGCKSYDTKISWFNGSVEDIIGIENSLKQESMNYMALSKVASNFFIDVKIPEVVIVAGCEPGDYCWKTMYGKIKALVLKEVPVYWLAEEKSLSLELLEKLGEIHIISGSVTGFLEKLRENFDKKELTKPEQDNINFSYLEESIKQAAEALDWMEFIADLLNYLVSRSHSFQIYEELLDIYKEQKNYKKMAQIYREMAIIFVETGYLDKSIEYHMKAIDQWVMCKEEKNIAKEYVYIGENYLTGASPDKAVQHYGEALSFYSHLEDIEGIAVVTEKLASICDAEEDYELARKYYIESLQAKTKLDSPLEEISCLLDLSNTLIKEQDWDKAKKYLEEAYELKEKDIDEFYHADICQQLGLVLLNLQDYVNARHYYEKAYNIYKKRQDKLSLTFVYCHLGHVCAKLEDYESAVRYYEQAIENYEKMGDWHHLAAVYNNLGFINSSYEKHSIAEEYFSRAAEIFAALGDVYNLIRTHGNLARVYTLKNEMENAIECYRANMEMLLQLDDKEELAATLVALAMIYLQSQQFKEAVSYLNQAIELYEALGLRQETEDTLNILTMIENKMVSSE